MLKSLSTLIPLWYRQCRSELSARLMRRASVHGIYDGMAWKGDISLLQANSIYGVAKDILPVK